LALKEVNDKLAEKELSLELTEEAKNFLVEKGFDEKFGARPLLRTIQRELEDPLAENILVSRYPAHTKIVVNFNKETRQLTFAGAKTKELVNA